MISFNSPIPNLVRTGGSNVDVLGVTMESIDKSATGSVHTVPGRSVTIATTGSDSITAGQTLYVKTGASSGTNHAGKATNSVPTSGLVYRIGFATAAESSNTVTVLWLPQFIADLG